MKPLYERFVNEGFRVHGVAEILKEAEEYTELVKEQVVKDRTAFA